MCDMLVVDSASPVPERRSSHPRRSEQSPPDGRIRILADGNQMPKLGLGVWQMPNGAACVNAVRRALDLGYRQITTAQGYGNEDSVRRALRDSGLSRSEVFLTTKFYPGRPQRQRGAPADRRRGA